MRSASNDLLRHNSWNRGSSQPGNRRREEAEPAPSIPHGTPPPHIGGYDRSSPSQAFTLVELLVVITVVAVLATVALASQGSGEHVLRAQCASNLRQIGVALNIYSAEADGYLPICGWPQGQNPWQTYEIVRSWPGTTNWMRGFVNLGLLFRTTTLTDARLLYCPAQAVSSFTYEYYATTVNGWPATPLGSGDDNIRAGYNYYPQLRAVEVVLGMRLPELNLSTVRLEFGGSLSLVSPMKLTEVNPRKSITTDLVHTGPTLVHRAQGSVAGLNALFPDGNVAFQNARTHPEKFDPALWENIGGNGRNFRVVMNRWEQ